MLYIQLCHTIQFIKSSIPYMVEFISNYFARRKQDWRACWILLSPREALAPAGRALGARAFDEIGRYHTHRELILLKTVLLWHP